MVVVPYSDCTLVLQSLLYKIAAWRRGLVLLFGAWEKRTIIEIFPWHL
jgi:hypothetical protein